LVLFILFYLQTKNVSLRYGILDRTRKSIGETKIDHKKLATTIVNSVEGIDVGHWQTGKTKIFMKEQVEIMLEKKRYEILSGIVVKVQRAARRFLGRRRRQKIIAHIKIAQRCTFLIH